MSIKGFLRDETLMKVIVSFFAFISAISTVLLSRSLNKSVIVKNELMILETRITDQWMYYQAKNIRVDLIHLAHALNKQKELEKFTEETHQDAVARKQEILEAARGLEGQRGVLEGRSEQISKVTQSFATIIGLEQVGLLLLSLVMIRFSAVMYSIGLVLGGSGAVIFLKSVFEYMQL